MFSRRDILKATAAIGAMQVLPAKAAWAAVARDSWSLALDAALKTNPLLLGCKPPDADVLRTSKLDVEGTVPQALRGVFFRDGPAVHERFGRRYRHWFDADGMVQAFRFEGGAISHLSRVLDTPKRAAEEKAGVPVYGGFGTPRTAAVNAPDDVNVANISMLDHGGELMALWERGNEVFRPDRLRSRGADRERMVALGCGQSVRDDPELAQGGGHDRRLEVAAGRAPGTHGLRRARLR